MIVVQQRGGKGVEGGRSLQKVVRKREGTRGFDHERRR